MINRDIFLKLIRLHEEDFDLFSYCKDEAMFSKNYKPIKLVL